MSMSPANRRYLARFIPTMVAYVVTILGVGWLFENDPPQGNIKYLIAILPALPIVGVIIIIGRYLVEETDEFMRMRHVLALLFAMGITLSLCTIWGFAENYAGAPHINAFFAFPLFCAAWLPAGAVVAWWYR
jgi:hypothetical protein